MTYVTEDAEVVTPQTQGAIPTVSSKSKVAAGLLGIFLGAFGVHNFYLGYTKKAVAQLLLTLIGWIAFGLGPVIATIWALIEAILILTSKPGTKWHKDGKGNELDGVELN